MGSNLRDPSVQSERSSAHIPTLDGWRAIAITLVILDDGFDYIVRTVASMWALGDYAAPDTVRPLKEYAGRLGVHLFFSLSGYLITARLLDEERARGSISLKEFYLRRLFRIQPAAMTYLLALGVLGWLGIVKVSSVGWVSALTGFANLVPGHTWYTGHFWSLAVEEHFYLFWPAAFVMMGFRFRLWGTLLLAVALGLWRGLAIKYQWTMAMSFTTRTDTESQWLVWGCLAALAVRRFPQVCVSARVLSVGAVSAGTLLCSALLLAGANWKIQAALVSLSAMLTPFLFVSTSRNPNSAIARLLEQPMVAWLGRISFSMYLWQQLFVVWDGARSASMGILQTLPIGIVSALLCASASYHFVERPMIEFGRRSVMRLRLKSVRPPRCTVDKLQPERAGR